MRPEHFTPVDRPAGSSPSSMRLNGIPARSECNLAHRLSSVELTARAVSGGALREVLVTSRSIPRVGDGILVGTMRMSAIAARRLSSELAAAAAELESEGK